MISYHEYIWFDNQHQQSTHAKKIMSQVSFPLCEMFQDVKTSECAKC
jgi:hypothetical protein